MCSSWVSHFPADFPATMKSIVATGMNPIELAANAQLTGGFVATDLNKRPVFPFEVRPGVWHAGTTTNFLTTPPSTVEIIPNAFGRFLPPLVLPRRHAVCVWFSIDRGDSAPRLFSDPSPSPQDGSFDVVTCVVSVDYLVHPREVFKEVGRVLRPGGKFVLSQSNRCALRISLRGARAIERHT